MTVHRIKTSNDDEIVIPEGVARCQKCGQRYSTVVIGRHILGFTCKKGHGWGYEYN